MSFINVGARTNTGEDFKSKKALKEALKNAPETVVFFTTSAFEASHAWIATTPGVIRPADTLSICGPNVYKNRKWYANYKDGKLT